MSLADLMHKHGTTTTLGLKALEEIASGLGAIHSLGIVHLNLNPDNIVVRGNPEDPGGDWKMLITNLEHSRQLEEGENELDIVACESLGPSLGWFAPEILEAIKCLAGRTGGENSAGRQLPSLAKAVDVFALGCLFFYILTRGGHPFGSVDVRDSNILRGIVCLDGLECLEARDLIMKMLASTPSER